MKRLMLISLMSAMLVGQSHAMMGRYLATLLGDACLLSTAVALRGKDMTWDDELHMRSFKSQSSVSQFKHDAEKIAPYAPALMPLGAVLSVGGRLSMIKKAVGSGLALAGFSIPANAALLGSGCEMRWQQAPDAGIAARAADTAEGWYSWYNRITGKKNGR